MNHTVDKAVFECG